MCIVPSTLLILLLLLLYSFVGASSLLRMFYWGIRSRGFTQSRWDALSGYWEAASCGPISSLSPWDRWIHPDLHGFYKWVFDSLGLLNDILKQVVVSRGILGFVSGPGGFVRI